MRIFHCDHCGNAVFFENTFCERCGHKLAYLPDLQIVASLDPAGDDRWTTPVPRAQGKPYRLCGNYVTHAVCNWAIPADRPDVLCASCQLTKVIPDLSQDKNLDLWRRLEIAKRRLVYSLVEFHLPLAPKSQANPKGLEFRFIGNAAGGPRVMTGHDRGVIVVNIAEADDVERERTRVSVHEPYRTLLGHFRHEIGHYYWDMLIKDSPRLDGFRRQFGDERSDYNTALQTYYREGPKPDWRKNSVTAYASVHPWEDWAETWAHYLHMTDAMETAAVCGMSMQPRRADEPAMKKPAVIDPIERNFDQMIRDWLVLTYALNSLNRGMGLADAYPFVLPEPTIEKLRFVDDTVRSLVNIKEQNPR